MSFQWQFVAAVLYVELGITLLLCLRPISSKWWSSLFKSSIAKKVSSNGSTVFYMLASILGLFCVDAWREMQKYIEREEQAKAEATVNPDTLNHILMWKFRSQRNLYISGFSLFLWIVIQRLASLLKDKATAKAEASAAKSQAESASRTAELLIDQNKENEEKGTEKLEQELKDKLKDMEKKLASAQKEAREANAELNKKESEIEAMKAQAKGLAIEYDRVCDELQAKDSGDKKSE